MEKFQPVIDWFTDRGGKYASDSAPSLYQDADTKFWEEIEHTGNHEIKYRGLQLFVTEVSLGDEKSIISLQYLLDHSRHDEDDNQAINTAIELLEPLLPEKAEFDLSCSIGTDIFLIRDLKDDDLEPTKLDEILTTLTKFAEFATTKVSILHLAPEFELKKTLKAGGEA
ncbi:hypothetical protein EMGBS4_18740 [Acidimicrobiaceae bacterium]|nr:hypothetical protein EMGBS4_18740 [Acidimicrobiaceae bacterium]